MGYYAALVHGYLDENKLRLLLTELPETAYDVTIKLVEVDRWIDSEKGEIVEGKGTDDVVCEIDGRIKNGRFECKPQGVKCKSEKTEGEDTHYLYLYIRGKCENVPPEIRICLLNDDYGKDAPAYDRLGQTLEFEARIEVDSKEVYRTASPTFIHLPRPKHPIYYQPIDMGCLPLTGSEATKQRTVKAVEWLQQHPIQDMDNPYSSSEKYWVKSEPLIHKKWNKRILDSKKNKKLKNEVDQLNSDLKETTDKLNAADAELQQLEETDKFFGDDTKKTKIVTDTVNGKPQLVPVTDSLEEKKRRRKRIRELKNKEIPKLKKERKQTRMQLDKIEPVLSNEIPPKELNNPDAVIVNLHLSGVTLRTPLDGRILRPDELHLDPIFAVAMAQYLEKINKDYGVSDIRAYFVRDPGSMTDKHSRGLSGDLHGFVVHGHEILLREGSEMDPTDDRYDTDHSDWYNEESKIPELENTTYAAFLKNQTEVMVDYFGQILSPYSGDKEHKTHYHVDLRGSNGKDGAIVKHDEKEKK